MQQVHKVVLCSSMESLTARATRECDNFMSERKHFLHEFHTIKIKPQQS
jgi:hypothetical protein